jgi:hypothetical protein
MSITPAQANDAASKEISAGARAFFSQRTSPAFPSYFHALTQFFPETSPRRSRRNHATKKSLSSQIALASSELRGV